MGQCVRWHVAEAVSASPGGDLGWVAAPGPRAVGLLRVDRRSTGFAARCCLPWHVRVLLIEWLRTLGELELDKFVGCYYRWVSATMMGRNRFFSLKRNIFINVPGRKKLVRATDILFLQLPCS